MVSGSNHNTGISILRSCRGIFSTMEVQWPASAGFAKLRSTLVTTMLSAYFTYA